MGTNCMNLIELDPKDYWRVKSLGAAASEIHLSVAAVIEGAAEGENAMAKTPSA